MKSKTVSLVLVVLILTLSFHSFALPTLARVGKKAKTDCNTDLLRIEDDERISEDSPNKPDETFAPQGLETASLSTGSMLLSSIEIVGNETYTLADGTFVLNESIVLRENATLVVQNAHLDFNVSSSTILEAYDNSSVIIANSTIYRIQGYGYAYYHDFATVSIQNSFLRRVYSYLYENSTTLVENSRFSYDMYVYGYSNLSIVGSKGNSAVAYDHSIVSVFDSTMGYMYVYDYSNVFVRDSQVSYRIYMEFDQNSSLSLKLPRGLIDQWNLYADNYVERGYVNLTLQQTTVCAWSIYTRVTSAVSIADSRIESITLYGNSTVLLDKSIANSLYVYDRSNASVKDSVISGKIYLEFEYDSNLSLSLPRGHIAYWNLYSHNSVLKAYINLTLQNSDATAWDVYAYRSAVSLMNTKIGYFYSYENSTMSMFNSTIEHGLYAYQFSNLDINLSSVNYMYVQDVSTLSAYQSSLDGVYASGNSSVLIRRSQIEYLGVSDYATVSVENSVILYRVQMSFLSDSVVSLDSLPSGTVAYWNLYENASIVKAYINLTLSDTVIRGWGNINTYDFTEFSLSNSTVESIYCYGSSRVILTKAVVNGLYAYGYSDISVAESFVDYFDAYDYSNTSIINSAVASGIGFTFQNDSKLYVTSLLPGWVEHWNLYENGTALKAYVNHTISNTWIGGWSFRIYDSSTISVKSSTLYTVYCYGTSTGTLKDSTLSYVYTYDSSEISIESCTLNYLEGYGHSRSSLFGSTVNYNAYVYDESRSTIANSKILSKLCIEFEEDSDTSNLSLPIGFVNYWSLSENATVISAYIELSILNSTINVLRYYVRGFSVISLADSLIEYIYTYDYSVAVLRNCTVDYVYAYGTSRVSITSSFAGKSIVTYLYGYDSSTVVVIESVVASTYAYEDSRVELMGSIYGRIRVYDNARVIVGWFLEVHVVDQADQAVPFANVTVTDQSAVLVYSGLTNEFALTRFALAEKTIDALGSYLAGSYNVTATYMGNSATEVVEMTENKRLTMTLPFIIPEYPTALILIALTVIALAALIFGELTRQQRKKISNKIQPVYV